MNNKKKLYLTNICLENEAAMIIKQSLFSMCFIHATMIIKKSLLSMCFGFSFTDIHAVAREIASINSVDLLKIRNILLEKWLCKTNGKVRDFQTCTT